MSESMHRASTWLITPLVAVISLVSVHGLSSMVVMGAWTWNVAVVLAVASAAVVTMRRFTRSRALPSLAGGAAVFLTTSMLTAQSREGLHLPIPTPEALGWVATSFERSIRYAQTSVAPAPMAPELLTALCLLFGLLFLLADHIASEYRAAALAGIVLFAPWMPAVILQLRVSVSMLVVGLVIWIVLLGLTRRAGSGDRGMSPISIGASAVVTMLLVFATVPTALGGNGWGAIPRISTSQDFDVATRLNLDVDLRTSLTTGSDVNVMRIMSTGRIPDVLRLYALTSFDGTSWTRDDARHGEEFPPGTLLWPIEPGNLEQGSADRITVQIMNLAETNLPIPADPRVVDVGTAWRYVSASDEVVTQGNGTQNLTYSVLAYQSHLNATTLSGMGFPGPLDLDAGIDTRYTALPASLDVERIYTLARDITADSQSRYDQALAIQTYFRNNREFEYDTTVMPTGSDAVSTFLDTKRGYCVQYATTMVMMLRSLDVPTRLAIGFLPGTAQADGSYLVAGRNAHAWPEVWFPEVGWVRFEPTPARQTGSVPRHADPSSGEIPVPQSVLDAAQQGGDVPLPTLLPNPGQGRPDVPDDVVAAPESATPWAPWTIGAAVVLLVAAAWWLRRRRNHGSAAWTIERGWEDIRLSGADAVWPPSATPHEAVTHLLESWDRRGFDADATLLEDVSTIVDAVVASRYVPEGVPSEPLALQASCERIVDVQRRLQETTDRPRRGGARNALRT